MKINKLFFLIATLVLSGMITKADNFVVARKKGAARISQDDIAQAAGQLVRSTNELVGAANGVQLRAINYVHRYTQTGYCTEKKESAETVYKELMNMQMQIEQMSNALKNSLLTQ